MIGRSAPWNGLHEAVVGDHRVAHGEQRRPGESQPTRRAGRRDDHRRDDQRVARNGDQHRLATVTPCSDEHSCAGLETEQHREDRKRHGQPRPRHANEQRRDDVGEVSEGERRSPARNRRSLLRPSSATSPTRQSTTATTSAARASPAISPANAAMRTRTDRRGRLGHAAAVVGASPDRQSSRRRRTPRTR